MDYPSDYEHGDGRGNGYDYDLGMSNNALDAYDRGVKPLSRISLADLKDAGWTQTKSLALFLAGRGFWRSTEWHHSGADWYNKVDFFDPSHLANKWSGTSDADRAALLEQHRESRVKTSESNGVAVTGSFTIWGGSRRRPRRMGQQAFTGKKKGDWIHLDSGGRKKASGAYITWCVVES
tara:strand:+ start:397 stop:933 length:537 start_codon:yes stop_codon:yes gene_type:complete